MPSETKRWVEDEINRDLFLFAERVRLEIVPKNYVYSGDGYFESTGELHGRRVPLGSGSTFRMAMLVAMYTHERLERKEQREEAVDVLA